MPNFNLHWLIAGESISSTPKWLISTKELYFGKAREFSKSFRKDLAKISNKSGVKDIANELKEIDGQYNFQNSFSEQDDAIAFSAYMCGACGPDFWTVSHYKYKLPSSTGSLHFDLGHYNRSHQQFIISINRLKGKNKTSLQSKVEMAYFLGMATHIAADLIIHQLVNRYAGAYNLNDKNWFHEVSKLPYPTWKPHNKVEHYWDTYIRLRYLGNFGPIFGDDSEPWLEPWNFMIWERLLEDTSQYDPQIKDYLKSKLDDDAVRIALERPLNFPSLLADRMIAGKITPFIHDVVLNGKTGAYPEEVVPGNVKKEKTKVTEKDKLGFFSTADNKWWVLGVHSHLNYYICPDLTRVRQFGRDSFYHLNALKPFIYRAIAQAKLFLQELSSAYEKDSPDELKTLTRFWNLDTGLGLRVIRKPSDTTREVITRIEFANVLDPKEGGVESDASMQYSEEMPHIANREEKQFEFDQVCAFPVYSGSPAKKLFEVSEEAGKYLERIALASPETACKTERRIDNGFFDINKFPPPKELTIKTSSLTGGKPNVILAKQIAHRLNLELGIGIGKLNSRVGFFFQGDKEFSLKATTDDPKKWLKKSRAIDAGNDSEGRGSAGPCNLHKFTTHLMLNLNAYKDLSPVDDSWNNIIPFKENSKYYGRNFAISTGRTNVLQAHLSLPKNFDSKDFKLYANLSPTEQIFFSLYALVATPLGIFDALTKTKIEPAQMIAIRKIESIGFVKIVLYYELSSAGACQLAECEIDGLRVYVEEDRGEQSN